MPIRRLILGPVPIAVSRRERLRSALGAAIGIAGTGLVCTLALGQAPSLPALIAPMGASAVLLFAVPASPLAQPRSILGGNLIAAIVGVAFARLVPDPLAAAALAIGVSIAIMMSLQCLHPPSGAIALTAVLGGPAIRELGFGFVVWPVAANSLLLLLVALAFNRLVGRTYPHRPPIAPPAHETRDPPASARVGITSADLDAVLADYDELLDIDRGDLEAILRQAQMRAFGRQSGRATCSAIMSRDVVSIDPAASIIEAFDLIRRHHVKALPVVDDGRTVVGIVTQTDLLDKTPWGPRGPALRARDRVLRGLRRGRRDPASIADIMTSPVRTIAPTSTLADAARVMAVAGLNHLPVVAPDGRLVGIVSQSDLIVALLAERGLEAAPA
ncbi:HPP family protein [Aureimonas sp. AU4]|uniref:HPP family protein n=1 Tax=Aureimonas sp. AU4 TaxID=1638163 RepID=UPI0007865F97|nr:HPP family protein [Aureimonas sp. AU4]